MDICINNTDYFNQNRTKFLSKLEPNSVCVLFSGMPKRKSADMDYPFFANRNFYYLTGIEQEGSALIIRKIDSKVICLKLLITTRNKLFERWNGLRLSKEQASLNSGIYDVEYAEGLDYKLDKIMDGYEGKLFIDGDADSSSNAWLANYISNRGYAYEMSDIQSIFSEIRAIKSKYEISMIRKAIDITGEGIKQILKKTKPGMKEYQVAAIFEYFLAMNGAGEPSFKSIVASGSAFNYLHYPDLKEKIIEGDMILIDLGARVGGLCSDISRAFPANGKFTENQLAIYNAVRECQKAAFNTIKPGVYIKDINLACMQSAAKSLIKLGILYKEEDVADYYWHNVSHHLGLDVHDVISKDVILEKGMVITVEPGIYVPEWNVGLRIEDDVLVTDDGCEILSASIPREPKEIEKLMEQYK